MSCSICYKHIAKIIFQHGESEAHDSTDIWSQGQPPALTQSQSYVTASTNDVWQSGIHRHSWSESEVIQPSLHMSGVYGVTANKPEQTLPTTGWFVQIDELYPSRDLEIGPIYTNTIHKFLFLNKKSFKVIYFFFFFHVTASACDWTLRCCTTEAGFYGTVFRSCCRSKDYQTDKVILKCLQNGKWKTSGEYEVQEEKTSWALWTVLVSCILV